MPVFIVVGENDTSCPPETQKVFYDLIPEIKRSCMLFLSTSYIQRGKRFNRAKIH